MDQNAVNANAVVKLTAHIDEGEYKKFEILRGGPTFTCRMPSFAYALQLGYQCKALASLNIL